VKPTLPNTIETLKKKRAEKQVEQVSTVAKEIRVLQAKSLELRNDIITYTKLLKSKKISETAYQLTVKDIEDELQNVVNEIATLSEQETKEQNNDVILNAQIEELQKVLSLDNEDINENVYRALIDRIEVYNGHILKYYLYGLEPITMQYKATGRMDKYQVEFTIL
jgi:hypothetical protein